MATKNNRTTRLTAEQKLIDGLTKHAGIITSLYVGGSAMTNAQIVSRLQALIAAAKTTDTARATWLASVAAERQLQADDKQFVEDVTQTVRAMFSTQPDVLADFGQARRKKPVLTAQAKVAAAVKAKATKQARGTRSKKELAAITGNVTGVVVTPVTSTTAAPATEPTAAPATAAPAVTSAANATPAPAASAAPKQS